MARYTDPVCRLCRRAGEKLFLKGERCFTPSCAIERRRRPPGEHIPRRRRSSDRGLQLREKQNAKYIYGVLERQFRKYYEEALKHPGVTGHHLLQLLERRLDSTVYRLNFADSRKQARQLVLHGHFVVNGRKTSIPSYRIKPGDVITWRPNEANKEYVRQLTAGIPRRPIPGWISLDITILAGQVLALPEPSDIDTGIDTRLIVQYYSR
ncbi:MAG: 30S ribosomal protein S4 [Chloroflexi bacterium]|nr:30S ribosomal protein S4 [Chloroflexota bacterium]